MGLFSGIKNNLRKAEAAALIQKLLEGQSKAGIFPDSQVKPSELANKLVEVLWDKSPSIQAAKPLPHKLSLAAAALASGANAMNRAGNLEMRQNLVIALGSVFMELMAASARLDMQPIDLYLIDQADSVYTEFSK